MIRKAVTIIAFGVGAWMGYNYALEIIGYYGLDVDSYWGEQGAEFIRIVLTVAFGAACAVAGYFLTNLYARAD